MLGSPADEETQQKQPAGLSLTEYAALNELRFSHATDTKGEAMAQGKVDAEDSVAPSGALPTDCAVCMTTFKSGQLLKRLPCHHVFCERCIQRWMAQHTTCPLCRLVSECPLRGSDPRPRRRPPARS